MVDSCLGIVSGSDEFQKNGLIMRRAQLRGIIESRLHKFGFPERDER